MNKKSIIMSAIAVVMIIAAAVFVRTFAYATLYTPDSRGYVDPAIDSEVSSIETPSSSVQAAVKTTTVAKPKPKPPAQNPATLTISSIGVKAHVETVGVTAAGRIGTPSAFADVGWYAAGPVPGKPGTAVFDGHVDNGLGLAGVFKHLADIQKGDTVTVTTNGGSRLTYTVTDIERYPYDQVPDWAMYSTTGTSQIRLITCEGNWVSDSKTYDERLIVTAVLNTN